MSDTADRTDDEVDDAYVLARWMHELAGADPNPAVIASLEQVAEDRGWHPYDAWRALTSARGLPAADFNPDEPPRRPDPTGSSPFVERR